MSSRRSRSGGTSMGKTLRRKKRSLRKRPSAIAAWRSRLVAAITRTSRANRLVAADPLELAFLQHAQQRHLDVGRQLADLVEEDRAAARPARSGRSRRCSAPVNAPFSWPNSSDADQRVGQRRQFTLIIARAARPERLWIARATSSLPGARLAGDQHGGVGRRDLLDLAQHLAGAARTTRRSPRTSTARRVPGAARGSPRAAGS